HNYMHPAFSRVSKRGVPFLAIVFTFLCGMIVFLPFPGWQQLVAFVADATVLAYALAPLALGALRRQDPDRDRPFRLPFGDAAAAAGFMVANLIIYWSGWTVVWRLMAAVALGFLVLAIAQATMRDEKVGQFDFRSALW